MTSRPVAVLDSGIGGLPYLSWLQSRLPDETLVYVADNAHFPYGEKTPEQLREVNLALAEALVDRYDPKLLLVACNTASVVSLEVLREHLSIPVVGVVPAVKTAAALGTKTLAVLATPRTVADPYWLSLAQQYAPHRRYQGFAAPDLVLLVEEGAPEDEKEARLAGWARRLQAEDVDALVLGCTHYLHLAEDLGRHLGPSVSVVDSREGVGRQVARVLAEKDLLSAARGGPDLFHFTARAGWDESRLAPLEARYRGWAARFGLEYAGPWVVGTGEAP